jgi:hypothetical protein
MAARQMGGLSLADALAFCLLLADVDPPRFDRAIARWHARFVLEAEGITAVLALCAAKGAASPRYARRRRQTVRRIADAHGLSSVADSFRRR